MRILKTQPIRANRFFSEDGVLIAEEYEVHLHMTFELDGVLEDINDPDSIFKTIKKDQFIKMKNIQISTFSTVACHSPE